MIQSLLNIITYFLQSFSNPIILISLGIFAATATVYTVKSLMHLR